MSKWDNWSENDNESPTRSRKKPDKRLFCRKNKNKAKYGKSLYGPHEYLEETGRCTFCTRLKNKSTITFNKETDDG
jgi:hypothetical protein